MTDRNEKVTARDAVKIVQDYYQYATGNYGLRLNVEEIEQAGSSLNWFVTMSYEEPPTYLNPNSQIRYKIFEVDSKTGEVISMKNPHIGF